MGVTWSRVGNNRDTVGVPWSRIGVTGVEWVQNGVAG